MKRLETPAEAEALFGAFSHPFLTKIKALYDAYAMDYPFCSFYAAQKGSLVAKYTSSCLVFLSDEDDREEVSSFLTFVNPAAISCNLPLDLPHDQMTHGSLYSFDRPLPRQSVPTANRLDDCFAILAAVFPTQYPADCYADWYCDLSHRIRHGISEVITLDQAATATLLCTDECFAVLSQVGVLPAFRGRGYGKSAVFSLLEKQAGKMGIVWSLSAQSDRFYQAIGFLPYGTWYEYHVPSPLSPL